MASTRRSSKVASLRSVINADSVRFLPSCLSKKDRHGHLGPPILIQRSLVAMILELPRRLSRELFGILALSHNFLFSSSFCAIVYNGVLRVSSLGLPARQYRRSSWLHAPHLGLGRPRLRRWCFRLFGGG